MLLTLLACASAALQPATPLDAFLGTWTGQMSSFGAEYPPVAMSLVVEHTENENEFTWQIRYGDTAVRDYVIRPTNEAEGEYEIDEKNSIVLTARLFSSAEGWHSLVSAFAIEPNGLTVSYHVEDDTMIFTVITLDNEQVAATGGEGEIPEVLTVPARSMQRAILTRAE